MASVSTSSILNSGNMRNCSAAARGTSWVLAKDGSYWSISTYGASHMPAFASAMSRALMTSQAINASSRSTLRSRAWRRAVSSSTVVIRSSSRSACSRKMS